MTEALHSEYSDGVDLYRLTPVSGGGTPVTAFRRLHNGREVPGLRNRLTFANVGGGTADVTVTTPDYSETYYNGRVRTVTLGVEAKDVVPGMAFTPSVSLTAGNSVDLNCGVWMGAAKAGNPAGETYSEEDGYQDPGLVTGEGAGAPQYQGRYTITNTLGETWTGAVIDMLPFSIEVPTSGALFEWSQCIAEGATEKTDGSSAGRTEPYLITIEEGSAPGLWNLRVDGQAVTYLNVNTISDTGLSDDLNETDVYQVTIGPTTGSLVSFQFKLDPAITDASTSEVYIFDPRWIERTADVGGLPDDDGWTAGPLTVQDADGTLGEVKNNYAFSYHRRLRVPSGAPWGKSPVPLVDSVIALKSGPWRTPS